MRNRNTQGFTLIELLIVIAIIGILAAVLIPNLLNARQRAFDSGVQACANSIQTAQEVHYIDYGTYDGLDKTAGAAAITASDTGGTFDLTTLGSACSQDQVDINTSDASSLGTTYEIEVFDTRGNRDSTDPVVITPTSLN